MKPHEIYQEELYWLSFMEGFTYDLKEVNVRIKDRIDEIKEKKQDLENE